MGSSSPLDNLEIASPCQANWDEMVGDDRQRFCASCGKDVYNIAVMSKSEVLDLVSDAGLFPCLRLFRRADGTVLTADCPVGVRAVRRHRGRLAARLVGVFSLLAMVAAAVGLRREADRILTQPGNPPYPPPPPTMGVPALVPPGLSTPQPLLGKVMIHPTPTDPPTLPVSPATIKPDQAPN